MSPTAARPARWRRAPRPAPAPRWTATPPLRARTRPPRRGDTDRGTRSARPARRARRRRRAAPGSGRPRARGREARSRRSSPRDLELVEDAQEGRILAPVRLLVDEPQAGQALEDHRQQRAQLHPGQPGAEAEVRSEGEGEVLVVLAERVE